MLGDLKTRYHYNLCNALYDLIDPSGEDKEGFQALVDCVVDKNDLKAIVTTDQAEKILCNFCQAYIDKFKK